MRKNFIFFLNLLIFLFILICCQNTKEQKGKVVNCAFDSSEFDPIHNVLVCYYDDKVVTFKKDSIDENILEVKKFFYSNQFNEFQKMEYVIFNRNKIERDKSSFIDFVYHKDNGIIDILVKSKYISSYMDIVVGTDTIKSKENKLSILMSKIRNLKTINSYQDKFEIDDSSNYITYVSSCEYSYREIVENKTILQLYENAKLCGLLDSLKMLNK